MKHLFLWPLTTEILPSGGGHGEVLWVEMFLEATFTSLTNGFLQNLLAPDEKCMCILVFCFVFFLDDLKEKLQGFVSETNSQRPGFIKMVRHAKQEGLIRSRVSGWRAATAPVVALFDAHVEFNVGW